jgi:transcriptional regulator with XRE-family HTH domain
MEKKPTIADRLKEMVQVKGTNANRLAREVGGTTTKYYKLLEGESVPNMQTIKAILDLYPDISAEWLIRGEGPMNREEYVDAKRLIELEQQIAALQELLKMELRGKLPDIDQARFTVTRGGEVTSVGTKNRFTSTWCDFEPLHVLCPSRSN